MTVRDQIQKLLDNADTGCDASDYLDEYVHDAASEMATSANNNGLKEQLDFLDKQGHTEEMVLEYLKEQLE